MSEMNRRQFVALAVVTAAAGACAECTSALGFEPQPRRGPATPSAGGATKVDMGAVSAFEKPGVYGDKARATRVIIVSDGKTLYALSAQCTHRGTVVNVEGETISCPAHGSQFSKDGKPTKDPAKAALFRHAIKITNGHVWVDKSKRFGEKEWGNKDASVSIEAKS